jgi:hypothetical protein
MEKVSEAELMQIKIAKLTTTLKHTEAEKAEVIAKATDLEFENLVLRIYLKYGLELGTDQITEDGTLIRSEAKEEKASE